MRPLSAYSSVTEGTVIEWASAACARVSLSVNCRTQFIITDKLTHVDRQVESKPENDSSLGNSSIEYDAAQIPRHIIDFSYLELMSKWNYFLLLFLKNVMLEIKLQRTYSTIVQKQVPTTMVKWTLVLILLLLTSFTFSNDMFLRKKRLLRKKIVGAVSVGSLWMGTCGTSQKTEVFIARGHCTMLMVMVRLLLLLLLLTDCAGQGFRDGEGLRVVEGGQWAYWWWRAGRVRRIVC